MVVIFWVILILIVGVIVYVIDVWNREVEMRNLVEAQQSVCRTNFDKMLKVIKQHTQVTKAFKDSFKDIYHDIIRGRYEHDENNLFKTIHEMNPDFTPSMYSELCRSIELCRAEFFNEQVQLISFNNQHKNLLEMFPSNLILAGKSRIEITIITSEETENVYESGREDDINLDI